jgi:4-amino-4-deoxy-L-arabinose transferase-like glycosyltransferase
MQQNHVPEKLGPPALVFLLLIALFFIVANLIWLHFDILPPSWDQSNHLLLTLQYDKIIGSGPWSGSFLRQLISVSHYYPPFFHLSALPVAFLLGFSEHHLIFVNFLYLILFTASMYGIGKELFDDNAGILAAAIALLYPVIFGLSREYLLDFALLAMVTAVHYFILKSDGGVRRPWNMGLGIAAGFALLIKPVAVIFFLPSLLYVAYSNFRQKKALLPLATVLVIVVLISGPWYSWSFADLMRLKRSCQDCGIILEGDPAAFIPSLIVYLYSLLFHISPVLFMFFLVGFFIFLISDGRQAVTKYLLIWALPAFLILILYPNKDGRYIVPILPVFAFFTTGGIRAIRRNRVRMVLYGSLFLFGLVQFCSLSFVRTPFSTNNTARYCRLPSRENWRGKEVIRSIFEYAGYKNITIGILPNLEYFNPSIFSFYKELLGFPYVIKALGDEPVTSRQLESCDVLIVTTPPLAREQLVGFRHKFYVEFNSSKTGTSGFLKKAEFALPHNGVATIYKNINSRILN